MHRGTVRPVFDMATSILAGASGVGMGSDPYSFASAAGSSSAGAHAELAVGGGEVFLDGLMTHVQRLSDLAVGASVGGHRRDPPLVGGEGVDAGEPGPARPRAGDHQFGAGALGERRGAAADREVERLAERLAGLGDVAAMAERDAEVGERARVLEPGRRGGQHVDRLMEAIEIVGDGAERAQRDPDRSRGAEAAGEIELLPARARARRPAVRAWRKRGRPASASPSWPG